MRVSMKWLKELVDVEKPVAELTELLDMTGTKVEAVHTVGDALSGVVIGRILTKQRHPEAEKLWVTTVDVGATEPLNIVCGAQNFEALDIVPVALVGTTLPNGMTIKRAKLRGVVSEGMNCSASELGLGSDSDGILVLPADAPVGVPFAEWRGLADTVLELEVTPNRPDCLSMAGVAREVGAVTGAVARVPGASPDDSDAPAADSATVEIEDPALCLRYTARVITGVKIGPSPDWLVERVAAAGARPISNIVDITNYVMYELGQPLHAFDLDTLGRVGGKAAITVRVARDGERLTTLDGQDRALAADTLLICDPSGPVALAGVMGGATTEVSDTTVNVLLESACFQPASTGRTSRRLGLISEASQRFERGVDPNGCVAAIDRAAALIAEMAGGQVARGVVDAYPVAVAPRALELSLDRLDAVVGEAIATVEVVGILERLGLSAAPKGDRTLNVTVPTFRPDLEREIDLVEEVLRVHGMGRVPSTLPAGRGRVGGLTLAQRRRERIGATLRAAGLNEAITWSFGDSEDMARTGWSLGPDEVPVRLLNPMSREQSVMRWTTLPGLLRAVSANQRKGVSDVHLYEIGAVWWNAPGRKQPKERTVVSGVLAGRWERPAWHEVPAERERELGFFDGKGVVASIMEDLAIARWRVRESHLAWLQPGRCAEVLVGSDVAGWLGEVHPKVLEAYECDGPVTVFELQMKPVLAAARDAGDFVDLPRFPAVKMDIALVVPDDVTAERVEDAITAAGRPLLESARLFDVYTGEGVPAGSRSLAFSLTYRDRERTLTDAEVASAHERLLRKVIAAVGGSLRS
jgi:phenylalanyl-tRNA synthetase beta chain